MEFNRKDRIQYVMMIFAVGVLISLGLYILYWVLVGIDWTYYKAKEEVQTYQGEEFCGDDIECGIGE